MPISILGLSRKHDGDSEHYVLDISSIEYLSLSKPFISDVNVTKIDNNLYDANIKAVVSVDTECSRCLKNFSKEVILDFHAYYADDPIEDQWPIEKNDLDIEEAIRQEVLFSLPAQTLCTEECNGIQQNN